MQSNHMRSVISLASFALILAALMLLYFQSVETEKKQLLAAQEMYAINAAKNAISNKIQPIISDLNLIADSVQLQSKLSDNHALTWQQLAKHIKASYQNWEVYDQIRYIDQRGLEKVRINKQADGLLKVMPDEVLQNKSHRYYFIDAMNTPKNEIYISPFDLNIEFRKVERPFKPMIRLAKPVFDKQGQKRGIVIINYLGDSLLEFFEQAHNPRYDQNVKNSGEVQLLNADGYWLHAANHQKNWGFMLKDRLHISFANYFTDEWIQMKSEESGMIESDKGIFFYENIYPLSGASIEKQSAHYYWTIVSHLDADAVSRIKSGLLSELLLIYVLILAAVSLLLWFNQSLRR